MLTRWTIRLAAVLLLLALGAIGGIWLMHRGASLFPRLTEHDVQQAVVTTLRREVPAAFLVAGKLEISADFTQEDTKYLLPEYFDETVSLGTTRSTVRLPGVATYGVDLHAFDSTFVALAADSTVIITIPGIEVQSVEPDLGGMMVQTEVGWARLSARSGRTVERQAIAAAHDALRSEANAHLLRSVQPLLNTEAAIERLLAPVLMTAGLSRPRIVVRMAPAVVEGE